ncbi:hypothetical protein [Raoultella ornithinolytica]|uniref:hypothetical protein n=1 Tax=Raoultella ornithinolytica TaxID=54291 RepID=UPI001967383D|nr:hypothetical protein [Raoultella ornithinolytica]
MKELIAATAVSMSSLDFLESIINPARVEAGEKPVRPSDFHARVNDEIDEKLNYENFVVGKTGHKTYYTTLTLDQMMLVGMRESKNVRRKVLEKLKALSKAPEPALPRTYKEALIHLVAQVEENERLTDENAALGEALSVASPKAVLMDRLAGTADQLYGVNEAGRIPGTSGAVMASCMEMAGGVFVKRKYTTTPRQLLKTFIDRGLGRNVISVVGGHTQTKFTFKGLCFIALLLIKRGIIDVDSISYDVCRDSVKEMTAAKALA